MKKCIGIISWLPDEPENRKMRRERVQRLFTQIESFWPDVDVLIITQNWKTTKTPKITNNVIRIDHEKGLGITKARQELQKEFVKLDYDYIIMFDDDAIIEETEENGAQKFMMEIDKHRSGFSVFWNVTAWLNGFVVSKDIYEKELFPDVDPQKLEAYEDVIYPKLLKAKYPIYEFNPTGIKCTQFHNPNEPAKSTWCQKIKGPQHKLLGRNTGKIVEYINKYKEFPKNYKSMLEKPEPEKKKQTYMGLNYFGL